MCATRSEGEGGPAHTRRHTHALVKRHVEHSVTRILVPDSAEKLGGLHTHMHMHTYTYTYTCTCTYT